MTCAMETVLLASLDSEWMNGLMSAINTVSARS